MSDQKEELERNYIFFRKTGTGENDVEQVEVPESELNHDQTQILTRQLHAYFNSMPDIVKDHFLMQVAENVSKGLEAAQKSRNTLILSQEEIDMVENGFGKEPLSFIKGHS